MSVINGIDALDSSLGRLFVVVGVFDGIHVGHDYLLHALDEEARRRDARPAVITFDHHPDEILTGSAPPLLCDPDERLARFEAAGVAVTVVQTFDVALRNTPFDAFVRLIAERVELVGFLMTPDSAFGYRRAGTPETVAALGRDLGYDVAVIPPFTLDGEAVSSSAIRAAIASGDFATAERLLGRPYAVVGAPTVGPDAVGPTPPDGAGSTTITFAMPVNLPPDGRYRVRVAANGVAAAAGWADVANGGLQIPGSLGSGSSGRVAITFVPGSR